MKVSVICIADRPERLPLLIWSLVAQTHIDWELIILDQSGSSRSVDYRARELPVEIDAKIRLVKCDRAGDWGQSAKEKAARDYASGSLLMFPNDDAYYVPTALAKFVEGVEDGADITICGWLYDQMDYQVMPPSTYEGNVDVGGFAITRRLFLQIGWQDKSQIGDAKLLAAAIAAGGRVWMTSRVLYVKN